MFSSFTFSRFSHSGFFVPIVCVCVCVCVCCVCVCVIIAPIFVFRSHNCPFVSCVSPAHTQVHVRMKAGGDVLVSINMPALHKGVWPKVFSLLEHFDVDVANATLSFDGDRIFHHIHGRVINPLLKIRGFFSSYY